jgi:hypothetical protein
VTCASVHAPVQGERRRGRTDREGPRRREREKGCAGQRLGDWRTGPARHRERESARAKETGVDRSAPLGNEREREGARKTGADRRGLPVRGGRLARGTRLGGLVWAKMVFLFPWIF